MSIHTVEIRAFSGPATVELAGVGVPEIVEVRQGPQGPAGTNGNAATIAVGTTTTGNAGTDASVTNSGTSSAAVFNFTIPRGEPGDTGSAGPNTVTSATTTDFTSGEVLFANSGVVGSVSRSGIDTRSEFPPSSHTHGNISNGGAIGTTADLAVVTGASGVLTTQSRSGIDSRTTFPNDDVTAATSIATRGTLVRRNASTGQVIVERLRVTDDQGSVTIQDDIVSGYLDIGLGNVMIDWDGICTLIGGSGDYAMPTMASGATSRTRQLRGEPIQVLSNQTANVSQEHIVTATCTLTDPTPFEGAWFRVIVRNGTATVGGTAYATSGTIIERIYHSGAWANRVYNETPVLGTNVSTALSTAVGSSGAFVVNGGALGTPSSGTLTNCTGLPISTGVSGLAANVATFLATPSSANLAAAVTDETGTGSLVFANSPSIATPSFTRATSGQVFGATGSLNEFVTFTTDSSGRAFLVVGGNPAATGFTGGAYLTAQGFQEAWMYVNANSNTSGMRVMRFGNVSNRFGIQRLNDANNSVTATPFSFANDAPTNSFYMHTSGGVSYGNTTDPGAGNIGLNGNQIRISTSQTPASASATGTTGAICWDANYIYVCTATNTWKRVAIATW